MHKGYKKTVAILITCALISALCFIPVSAEGYSYEALPISITKTWPENISYSQSADNYVSIRVPYPALANKVSTIWTCHNEDTKNYYHYKFVFVTSIIEPYNFMCTFDGVEYEVKKDYNVENTYYIEIENIKISSPSARLDFNFTFSSNTTGYLYFMAYYQYSDLNPIIDNQNENTDKIIENQNQNTQAEIEADKENTQDIIDNQNALAEQEKQEITDSGNQATDAMDSIPNESEGFINALGTFVSTMSTTDTACSITFPAIKTPSFAGIPAATLSEEKEVDFSTAISLIPSDIMRLIQALTTIALIVFCFKELYDTISEALTRKKANSDG